MPGRWLHELSGTVVDLSSNEWTEAVRTLPVPLKHLGIGISTNTQAPLHTIISIQAGSAVARNGNMLVGESIGHIDTAPTSTVSHAELHRSLLGLEYTPISLGISVPGRFSQTLSVLRSPLKTPQISWARALDPFRDRRQALEKATSSLTKDRETELVFLSVGETSFVML